jgi:hypothetical protein
MNERKYAELVLNGGLVCHPGRFAFFVAWAATHQQPRQAIWSTTALFGGVGCSIMHAHNATEAVFIYLLGYAAALAAMVPWFFAEYRINAGWLR